ncbi:MAG: hypothetical protein RL186_1257 [Pseudomonadota bacterium]
MLHVSHLHKSFGGHEAVKDIGFDVEPGEIVACLGPNGAGKTTTLRMIAGTLEPDAGSVSCNGVDMWTHRTQAQAHMGYLPEGAPLYPDMTPLSYLDFLGQARGLRKNQRHDLIAIAVARTALEEVLQRPIATLSKGFARRVALAGAILHDPKILILDEPTDGLDPNQKRAIHALMKQLSHGRVIVISTHRLDDVSAMCTRALVIAKGKVVADATPDALAKMTPSHSLDDAFAALTLPQASDDKRAAP